jgi:hypothetical protein
MVRVGGPARTTDALEQTDDSCVCSQRAPDSKEIVQRVTAFRRIF